MSLRKVSDLEGVSEKDISAEMFNNALLEVSNPVSNDIGVYSYKSMYIRNSTYLLYVGKHLSSFDQTINFYDGINLSGDLCCNADNPDNNYTAIFNFGNKIEMRTSRLSVMDEHGHIRLEIKHEGSKFTAPLSAIDKVYFPNTENYIRVSTPSTTVGEDEMRAANKKYVDDKILSITDGIPSKFGMFASCDYAIVNDLPATLLPHTFYFVIEST